MKRVGVLGGTFNPVHLSHIMIACRAYDMLGLDKVLFMPAKNPTYKNNSVIVSEEDRCNMIEYAIKGYPYFELSDFELKREGPTYSSDTFKMLKAANPDTKYYFIIGGDSLDYFDSWHEPQVILENCTLVVAPRASKNRNGKGQSTFEECQYKKTAEFLRKKYTVTDGNGVCKVPEIIFISSPLVSISSSEIREYLKCGINVSGLLPESEIIYIKEKGIYEEEIFKRIKSELKNLLNPKRFIHVLNVAETSFKLAKLHGYDPEKAYAAGLLHDCAKYLSDEEILSEAEKCGIIPDDIEKRTPQNLLHSKVGACWAKEKYGIEDEEIINAIFYHTTGKPNMNTLEMILYLSDVLEPGRTMEYTPSLDVIRSIATYDLNLACAHILNNVVPYILKTYKENVCMLSVDTYEYYKKYLEL